MDVAATGAPLEAGCSTRTGGTRNRFRVQVLRDEPGTPDPGIKNFQIYIDSQQKMAERAAATRATVLLANHSEFDNAVNKNRMLAGRGSGAHPYEIGADWVQRYFQVTQGCARAAQLRLEQKAVETSKR